ncbi:hypothetical protein DACRYDRAFT_17769 [Dacryopinax primogenitus]|uniref:Amidoligase enzyme n=1 Tax=Dacryopinax primogenitus (strain DJM 731) TaxID=1858805 RepID=M5FT22_DACPD|nr:uncharacterized protein DACRYDRAFT_17769 [Dacryopinax primogenitus]EJT99138.1 hypothetical protein DACRYDRAFT_17769 [Dacryopinax primogenitus]
MYPAPVQPAVPHPLAHTLGFEIEFLIQSDLQLFTLQQEVAHVINTTGLARARPQQEDAHPGTGVWLVGRDSSITGGRGEQGIEIITGVYWDVPGLEGATNGWRNVLRGVFAALQRYYKQRMKTSKSAALHVHVGVGVGKGVHWEFEDAKRLAYVVTLMEAQLDMFHSEERRNPPDAMGRAHMDQWIHSLRYSPVLAQLSNEQVAERIAVCKDWEPLLLTVQADWEGVRPWRRGYRVNFLSLEKYGTVEFRQHACSIDGDEMVDWGFLLLRICRWVRITSEGTIRDMCVRGRVKLVDLFPPTTTAGYVDWRGMELVRQVIEPPPGRLPKRRKVTVEEVNRECMVS